MPIKEPLLFISIEDFKNWKGFDKLLFENVTNSNENIWFAISIASNNIDYLSGFAISKKWPEPTPTTFTDNIQTATAHYVRFLCTKGVDYTRGQASMAQGGIVYSESNPNDPYYIPPEVFNYLRDIKEYIGFQGFNLNVKPKTSFFSKFLSNKGEINPLENYLQITNIIGEKGIKVTKTHPINIMGTVVTFSSDNDYLSNEIIINKEYSTLTTNNQYIIGAINELKSLTPTTTSNDNFITFFTNVTSSTTFNIRLVGKISVFKNGIKSNWSLFGMPTNAVNPTFANLGTSFYCFNEDQEETLPIPITITGTWGQGTQLINNYRGFGFDQVDDTKFVIYFNTINNASSLDLNIIPLVIPTPPPPTPIPFINTNRKASMHHIMPLISNEVVFDEASFILKDNKWYLNDEAIINRFEINNKQNKIIGDKTTLTTGADGYIDEQNKIRIYDAPKEPVALRIIKYNKYDDLLTKDKRIIGSINELYNNLIEEIKNIPIWKTVGQITSDNEQIKYKFILGKTYKVWYHFGDAMDPGGMPRSYISKEFLYNGQFSKTSSHYLDYWENSWNKKYFLEIFADKIILSDPEKSPSVTNGQFLKLEELQ